MLVMFLLRYIYFDSKKFEFKKLCAGCGLRVHKPSPVTTNWNIDDFEFKLPINPQIAYWHIDKIIIFEVTCVFLVTLDIATMAINNR